MNRRTELVAARHDRLLDWACDDLFAALVWANQRHCTQRLAAVTPADRFAVRLPLCQAERNTFRDARSEQLLDASTDGDSVTDAALHSAFAAIF